MRFISSRKSPSRRVTPSPHSEATSSASDTPSEVAASRLRTGPLALSACHASRSAAGSLRLLLVAICMLPPGLNGSELVLERGARIAAGLAEAILGLRAGQRRGAGADALHVRPEEVLLVGEVEQAELERGLLRQVPERQQVEHLVVAAGQRHRGER